MLFADGKTGQERRINIGGTMRHLMNGATICMRKCGKERLLNKRKSNAYSHGKQSLWILSNYFMQVKIQSGSLFPDSTMLLSNTVNSCQGYRRFGK